MSEEETVDEMYIQEITNDVRVWRIGTQDKVPIFMIEDDGEPIFVKQIKGSSLSEKELGKK